MHSHRKSLTGIPKNECLLFTGSSAEKKHSFRYNTSAAADLVPDRPSSIPPVSMNHVSLPGLGEPLVKGLLFLNTQATHTFNSSPPRRGRLPHSLVTLQRAGSPPTFPNAQNSASPVLFRQMQHCWLGQYREGAVSPGTWAAFRSSKRQGNGLPLDPPEGNTCQHLNFSPTELVLDC